MIVRPRNNIYPAFLVLIISFILSILNFPSPVWAQESASAPAKAPLDSADQAAQITQTYPLEVLAVKPNVADSREVHQITVTFNKPMVPLGDFEKMAQGLPVSVAPEIPCHWRWLNRMTLAC